MRAFKAGFLGCFGVLLAIIVGVIVLVVVGGSCTMAALDDDDVKSVITGDARDVIVKVDGTAGLAFSGSIGAAGGSRTVDGAVPQSFTIPGADSSGIFTAVLQKQADAGTLIVTLNCNGGDKSGETSAAYGVVTVTCSPY